MRRRADRPAIRDQEPRVTYINHPTGVWDIHPLYGAPYPTRHEAMQNFVRMLSSLHPTQTHTVVRVVRESLLDHLRNNEAITASITTHAYELRRRPRLQYNQLLYASRMLNHVYFYGI